MLTYSFRLPPPSGTPSNLEGELYLKWKNLKFIYLSSYQAEWVKSKSYVVVINIGTADDVQYEYFVAAQDKNNHAIPLMNVNDVTRTEVIGNAKNKMEVTIQALCGNETGKKTTLSTIKGLENLQPVDLDGNKIDWNATIYSGDDCAS